MTIVSKSHAGHVTSILPYVVPLSKSMTGLAVSISYMTVFAAEYDTTI